MIWPPCSPDLNPIENLWGYVSQQVYKNWKQFTNKSDLKNENFQIWQSIPNELWQQLSESMKRRFVAVTENDGRPIKY
jgi:transposase